MDIGVGQGLALSPILSALYISPVFHILEKCLKILKIPVSILSFINDSLFIAQNKSLTISNSILFCSYNVVFSILDKFGLVLEYGKCCSNHLLQRQIITQAINLLVGYQVGNSQENSTRSLFLIRVLFIQMSHGPCY